ncbi:MAG: GNAT family N-acetyltransferase [SAR86 cluster bacterium]|nr:GNAT family N-acetyltransferase [SAR86 cluster bacterium]
MKKYSCLADQVHTLGDYLIRPVQNEEINQIRLWRNEQIEVLRQDKLINKSMQIDYFKRKIWPQYKKDKPEQILLSIYKNKIFIGYGGLVYINWDNLSAEVSFLLCTERMSKHELYSKDFKSFLTLIKYLATKELNLNYLTSETYVFRKKHIEILENASFEAYGAKENTLSMQNKKYDSILHKCNLQINTK